MSTLYFDQNFSNEKQAICDSLARFVLRKLLPKDHARITIIFEMHPDMIKKYGDTGAMSPEIEKNAFLIELDTSITLKEMCLSIIHELVHVKQIILGECSDSIFSPLCSYDTDPLEIEATAAEGVLFAEWNRRQDQTISSME